MKYEGKGELGFLRILREVDLMVVDYDLRWAVTVLVIRVQAGKPHFVCRDLQIDVLSLLPS